ncbi:MAG: peptide chain release factor N(5)-glutamine methyltransferase [Acidobacteriota bacterium]
MTLSELFQISVRDSGKEPADILIIIEKAFDISKEQFWKQKNSDITNKKLLLKFNRYLKRLIKNEPVAYILGNKEFYSEKFLVNKNVLIPRPETELLVEKVLETTSGSSRILDIGAGSGVISIMIAKKTHAEIVATELDKNAIKVLKKNIQKHNVKSIITPLRKNLFPEKRDKFDIIVSNPPYLSVEEYDQLPDSIKKYEPEAALIGGEKGDEIIRRIISGALNYLKPGGFLFLEIGFDQKNRIRKHLSEYGFSDIEFFKDYQGISRIVKAKL